MPYFNTLSETSIALSCQNDIFLVIHYLHNSNQMVPLTQIQFHAWQIKKPFTPYSLCHYLLTSKPNEESQNRMLSICFWLRYNVSRKVTHYPYVYYFDIIFKFRIYKYFWFEHSSIKDLKKLLKICWNSWKSSLWS